MLGLSSQTMPITKESLLLFEPKRSLHTKKQKPGQSNPIHNSKEKFTYFFHRTTKVLTNKML
jgi:hypothetical protein